MYKAVRQWFSKKKLQKIHSSEPASEFTISRTAMWGANRYGSISFFAHPFHIFLEKMGRNFSSCCLHIRDNIEFERVNHMFWPSLENAFSGLLNHELSYALVVYERSFVFSIRMTVLISQQRNLQNCGLCLKSSQSGHGTDHGWTHLRQLSAWEEASGLGTRCILWLRTCCEFRGLLISGSRQRRSQLWVLFTCVRRRKVSGRSGNLVIQFSGGLVAA